ncbi:MAG: multiubiquitin domain-containing protein [Planctomycetaceae bacterium]
MMATTAAPGTDAELPDEIEDLEVCSREGREPRCVRRYRIRIDKEPYIVHVTHMTGLQLLELAGKCDIGRWKIFQKMHGGSVEEIRPDQAVSFTKPGIEKFKTLPLDQTEG